MRYGDGYDYDNEVRREKVRVQLQISENIIMSKKTRWR